MKLSAENFEQIVSTLRSDRAQNGTTDRRGNPRVGLRQMVTLVTCTGATSQRVDVRLRDLSQEGVGILHHVPLPKSALFFLLLDRSTGGTLKVLYRVARCEKLGDRQYLIGGRLDRVIDQASGPIAGAA